MWSVVLPGARHYSCDLTFGNLHKLVFDVIYRFPPVATLPDPPLFPPRFCPPGFPPVFFGRLEPSSDPPTRGRPPGSRRPCQNIIKPPPRRTTVFAGPENPHGPPPPILPVGGRVWWLPKSLGPLCFFSGCGLFPPNCLANEPRHDHENPRAGCPSSMPPRTDSWACIRFSSSAVAVVVRARPSKVGVLKYRGWRPLFGFFAPPRPGRVAPLTRKQDPLLFPPLTTQNTTKQQHQQKTPHPTLKPAPEKPCFFFFFLADFCWAKLLVPPQLNPSTGEYWTSAPGTRGNSPRFGRAACPSQTASISVSRGKTKGCDLYVL